MDAWQTEISERLQRIEAKQDAVLKDLYPRVAVLESKLKRIGAYSIAAFGAASGAIVAFILHLL